MTGINLVLEERIQLEPNSISKTNIIPKSEGFFEVV
jgi:hypothetical protein